MAKSPQESLRLPTTMRTIGFIKITRDDIIDTSIEPEEIDLESILNDSANYHSPNSKLETLWFLSENDLPKNSAYSPSEILGISEATTIQDYYPKALDNEQLINGEIGDSLFTDLESEFWNNIVKPTFSTGLPDWLITQLKWEPLQRGSSDDILTYAKTLGSENFSHLETLFGSGFIDRLFGVIVKAPGIVFKYDKTLTDPSKKVANLKENTLSYNSHTTYERFLIPPGVLLGLPLINPSQITSIPRTLTTTTTSNYYRFKPIKSSLEDQYRQVNHDEKRNHNLTFGSLPISNTAFKWYLITHKDIEPTRETSGHPKYHRKKYEQDNPKKVRNLTHISPFTGDGFQSNLRDKQIILNSPNTAKRNVKYQEKEGGTSPIPKKYLGKQESHSYSPPTMVAIMDSRKKRISPFHDTLSQGLSQEIPKNTSSLHPRHIANMYNDTQSNTTTTTTLPSPFQHKSHTKQSLNDDGDDDDDDGDNDGNTMRDIRSQGLLQLPRIISNTGNNDIQVALEILRDQKEALSLRCHYFTHHSNSLLSKYMDSFECNICASPNTIERWEVGGQKPGLLLCSDNCYQIAAELVNLLSSVTSNYDNVRRQLYAIQSKIDIKQDNIKPLDVGEFKELTRLLIRVLLQSNNTITPTTPDPIHRLYELREKRLCVGFSNLTKSMHYATQCPEKILTLSQDIISKLVSQNVFFIQYPEAETRLCILANDPPQGNYELIDVPPYAPQFLHYWRITSDTSHLSISPLNIALIKGNNHHNSSHHYPGLSTHPNVVRSFTVTTNGIQHQHQHHNHVHYHREDNHCETTKTGSMGWRTPTSVEIAKMTSNTIKRNDEPIKKPHNTRNSHFIIAKPQDMFLCSPGLRIASVDKSSIHTGHPLHKCNIGTQDELWEITRVQSRQ